MAGGGEDLEVSIKQGRLGPVVQALRVEQGEEAEKGGSGPPESSKKQISAEEGETTAQSGPETLVMS